MKAFLLVFLLVFITFSQQSDKNCRLECLSLGETKCEICYKKCNTKENEIIIKMSNCTFKECFFESDQKCVSNLKKYLLEDECLQKCCISNATVFTAQQINNCNLTNTQLQDIKAKKYASQHLSGSEVLLMLFLYVSLLIGAVVIAETIKHKRNEKKLQIKSQACDKQSIKKLNWEDIEDTKNCTVFKQDDQTGKLPQCIKCKKPHPNCEMDCGHVFHVSCLRKLSQKTLGKCPSPVCNERFICIHNYISIFCQKCKVRKASKVNIKMTQQGLQKILNFMQVICDKCIQNPNIAAGNLQLQKNMKVSANAFNLIEQKQ